MHGLPAQRGRSEVRSAVTIVLILVDEVAEEDGLDRRVEQRDPPDGQSDGNQMQSDAIRCHGETHLMGNQMAIRCNQMPRRDPPVNIRRGEVAVR